jgi:hypothetical protein
VQLFFEKKGKIKGKERSSVFSSSGFKFCKAAIYKHQREE